MRASLLLFVCCLAILAPSGSVRAATGGPALGTEASTGDADPSEANDAEAEADARARGAFDDLGRPFPDPALLRRSGQWLGAGAILTASGAGLMLGGMTLGLAYAREEIEKPAQGTFAVLSMFVGGASCGFVGVPLVSAGWYMRQQLTRRIKGAEKVPRTVANEARYWSAYAARMYGQAMMVTGGGSVLLGVLAIVAVGALVGTDLYEPGLWAGVAQPFGVGATLIAGAIVLQKAADARMEEVRREVDPMRREASATRLPDPLAFVPAVVGGRAALPDGRVDSRVGLVWGWAF